MLPDNLFSINCKQLGKFPKCNGIFFLKTANHYRNGKKAVSFIKVFSISFFSQLPETATVSENEHFISCG